MLGLMLIIIFEIITLLLPRKIYDSKGLNIIKAILGKTMQEGKRIGH